MSARLTSLIVLVGLIVGGLVLQATYDDDPVAAGNRVDAGIAIPAARAEPTLSSTWFCAGGTAYADGFADHVLLLTNPSDRDREATITVLTGQIAEAPAVDDGATTTTAAPTTTRATTTTTTVATTTTIRPDPTQATISVPAQSRVTYRVGGLVEAQLAGAVIEVDGGEIAVEHELTGDLGRATAPCSTTASSSWSFPWGVTERGARELLVFMNPFPDDATVDITFATDEGARDTLRFDGFVVPGRSVVGAYIDQDVTRKAQVSAQVRVRGGRLVIDRIQMFDGTDTREGITVGLGAPAPAETWMFPDGLVGPGLAEQIVVFNPSDGVAEVEVEVRLEDPATNGIPEPFDLTVRPDGYAILDVHAEERIPAGVPFSLIALANGQRLFIEGVQDLELEPGARGTIRLGDHTERPDLPIVLQADGPVVAERGLYRVGGLGMSQAMGIPLAEDTVVPDPLDG
jgi:hypothetical protein